jgi:hypothetical protein
MSTWSIADTRNLVNARFGAQHRDLVAPSLYAMAQRQNYARYHFHEVRRLLVEFQDKHLKSVPLLIVSHGADDERRADFQDFMAFIGAHALAGVLSIHGLADVTAYAAYQALGYGLRPNPVPEGNLYAGRVVTELRKTPEHGSVADIIEALTSDAGYKHVAALANRSKHQAIVRPLLSEDWTGARDERHEVRFEGFKHKGTPYPEVEIGKLLAPVYALASRTTIDVGNQLNALLK